ncbi:MAG: histidine phosphotransferase family protein [Pseudomonadota bacterium]
MIDPALLSAYIASRICHDLVSPVSSITNALDMLESPADAEMRQMSEDLLKDGAKSASTRLQFLRYAFGSVGLSDGAADIHEAKTITEAFVASHKPSLSWDIETDHLSFSHARLMMNLVMIAVESLPRGGVIHMRIRNEQSGMTMTLSAKGLRAKLRADTVEALAGGTPAGGWEPRNIQALFARMLSEGLGAELSANAAGEEEVIIMAQGVRPEG